MKLAKFKPYLKKTSVYKNGESPIYICIKKNRKEALINLGYSVPSEAWNEEEGRVYESKPKITPKMKEALSFDDLSKLNAVVVLSNAKSINAEIQRKVSELTLLQDKIRSGNEDLDPNEFKQRYFLNPDQDRNKSFLAYANEIRDNLYKAGNIGTYKRYKTVIKRLEEFLSKKPFTFKDLTVQFLREYDIFLKSKKLAQSSIHNHQKTIRAIYYLALSEQLVPQDKNPYLSFKLKTGTPVPKSKLSIEEILRLENLDLDPSSKLFHVRNCFIFSLNNAGIRVGDLIQLKWENITNEGRLQYLMEKTSQYKSTILNSKALAILQLYFTDSIKPEHYIFPFLGNDIDYSDKVYLWNQVSSKTAIINNNLKKLATLAKINKKLSSHVSRHTFGGLAIDKKASIYDLKQLFEHSSVSVTEQYIKGLSNHSMDEAMLDILNF